MEFSNAASVRAIIDSVLPAPTEVDLSTWASSFSLTNGQNGPNADPDQDGFVNLLEFSAGSNPLDPSEFPFQRLEATPAGFSLTIRRSTMAGGIVRGFQTGPLDNFTNTMIDESNATTISLEGGVEEITIPLPANFGPFIRQTVTLP